MKRYLPAATPAAHLHLSAGIAASVLLMFAAGPALADVAGTMTSANTQAVNWVRAGAALGVIGFGVSMVRGWMGAWGFAPLLAGTAVAVQPEEIVSLIA